MRLPSNVAITRCSVHVCHSSVSVVRAPCNCKPGSLDVDAIGIHE